MTMQSNARPRSTLLLDRADIKSLLDLSDCIAAVEEAFRAHALGETLAPGMLHVDGLGGEFHIKAGGFKAPAYFGLKANAGFFQNAAQLGLPNIQGLILLYDAENGRPLAVMDSGAITIQRTGAATAVAAKHLARRDSMTVTICGSGAQGRIQLRALTQVLPLESVFVWDRDSDGSQRLAHDMSDELNISIDPVQDLGPAVLQSDVCVTCTPSREAFLHHSFVRPGTFVAAVGADSPGKQELDPHLLVENAVVVDLLDQCVSVGELQHAIHQGLMTSDDVRGELGNVITGTIKSRTSDDEIIVFDSTGTALQDTAAAVLAYDRALKSGVGRDLDFTAI